MPHRVPWTFINVTAQFTFVYSNTRPFDTFCVRFKAFHWSKCKLAQFTPFFSSIDFIWFGCCVLGTMWNTDIWNREELLSTKWYWYSKKHQDKDSPLCNRLIWVLNCMAKVALKSQYGQQWGFTQVWASMCDLILHFREHLYSHSRHSYIVTSRLMMALWWELKHCSDPRGSWQSAQSSKVADQTADRIWGSKHNQIYTIRWNYYLRVLN